MYLEDTSEECLEHTCLRPYILAALTLRQLNNNLGKGRGTHSGMWDDFTDV